MAGDQVSRPPFILDGKEALLLCVWGLVLGGVLVSGGVRSVGGLQAIFTASRMVL
ncbi:hypothetical protein ABH935_010200 [Catenulispora sp. GAS73]|uniref:hypothetical protein n=1 Tax=Catenulispora sp. GAS73 TaxID=3156269 RepID=UPI00351195B4